MAKTKTIEVSFSYRVYDTVELKVPASLDDADDLTEDEYRELIREQEGTVFGEDEEFSVGWVEVVE